MAVDKSIKYEDKKLTEKQKKKIKPANQGGGPNYLGKQETVTVPKKWLSDPDHVVAELAYITPKEQKILLDANIYGSLDGKPNKGPGGIMSLQGDLGGYGGGSPGGKSGDSSGKGGGGSKNYKDTDYYKMMTGQLAKGQTTTTGPRTRQYSNLPEYMKVKQKDGTYKDKYIGSAYKSYGTPSFFGNLFSRGAPGYRGIKGLSAFGTPTFEATQGPDGLGYYTDDTDFGEIRDALPTFGLLGLLSNLSKKFKKPKDMSRFNKLQLVDGELVDDPKNTMIVPDSVKNPSMESLALQNFFNKQTPQIFSDPFANTVGTTANITNDAVSTLANPELNRMKGYLDGVELPNSKKEIPTVNGVPMIDTGSVYQNNLDFFDNLNKGIVKNNNPPMVNTDNVMQGSVLDAKPKKGIMQTISDLFFTPAGAAEVKPAIKAKDTGLGFSIPTGDVGLNASGRLGNLSATVDAIEALKGESVNPELNYSGQFGNTNVYGNYSDDVQNIGLNFNNDKGLSGGISYDAITGEPRFDIGFSRTFADGGLASMFTRRG